MTWVALILSLTTFGQSKSHIDTLSFEKNITDYSIDASGNIYVALEGGSIRKYSGELDSLITYSPSKVGNVRLLEAGGGLRIFAFYDFYQEYLLLDRFLTQPVLTKLSDSSLDFVEIAAPSQDNNVWLIENTGLRLIKYNVTTHSIDIETSLSSIIEKKSNSFTYIKEYQNQVYLVDERNGIYIFDNLGNYLKRIAAQTKTCSFFGNNIYYVQDNGVIKLNIYTGDKSVIPIKSQAIEGVLVYKDHLYYILSHYIIRAK